MKRIALCLVACFGLACEYPCQNTEYFISGFCVVENGYDIDPAMIEVAVEAVEYAFAKRGIELPDLAEDIESHGFLRLEFVDKKHQWMLPDVEEGYGSRGYWGRLYDFRYMYVVGDVEFRSGERRSYHVIAHELIHYVLALHLGVDINENAGHTDKEVWNLAWENAAPARTVENLAYAYISARQEKE